MSEIRLCKCGCGQPVTAYLNPSGKSVRNQGWYAHGHGTASSPGASRIPANPIDLAYAAGLVDGEGCIYGICKVYRGSLRTVVRLSILMCSRSTMSWIHEKFGGSLYELPHREGRPDRFLWQVGCSHSGPVLRALIPYLIEKREQAVVALQLLDLLKSWGGDGETSRIPQENVDARIHLCKRLKQLKRSWQDVA